MSRKGYKVDIVNFDIVTEKHVLLQWQYVGVVTNLKLNI